MQATLSRCLVVVLTLALLLSPTVQNTPEMHRQAALIEFNWPSAEELARRARAQATEVRFINYLKAHWKTPEELAQTVVRTAIQQSQSTGLPVTLILAVIAKESSFRPTVESSYGAQGLMQVVPRFHAEKLEGRPEGALLNPEHNIEVGSWVLVEYLDKAKGDARKALRKYSGGANAYYERVMRYQAQFERVSQDDRYLEQQTAARKRSQ
jgi:soluble lytic murein transglycosylase-like protein